MVGVSPSPLLTRPVEEPAGFDSLDPASLRQAQPDPGAKIQWLRVVWRQLAYVTLPLRHRRHVRPDCADITHGELERDERHPFAAHRGPCAVAR